MKRASRTYSFERSEIFIMFLLLVCGCALVFSIGVMLGKRMLENECKLILEDTDKKLKECQVQAPAVQSATATPAADANKPEVAQTEVTTPKEPEADELPPLNPFIQNKKPVEPAKKSAEPVKKVEKIAPKQLPAALNTKSPVEEKLAANKEPDLTQMQHLGITEITPDIKGKYTVQISSHRDETEAQKIAFELYDAGYKSSYYIKSELKDKGTWYRVGIGFFPKKDSAELFAEMLKKQGKISSYIIRKVE